MQELNVRRALSVWLYETLYIFSVTWPPGKTVSTKLIELSSILYNGFVGAIVMASVFTSEIVGSILDADSWHVCKKSQSTFYWKSWVFSEHSSFLPQGIFHRSCAPWSDMSHKVAARGALRKPSTGSGWATSIAIQLSSQLQVKMIRTPPPTHSLFK
jgi:hypothetical protein